MTPQNPARISPRTDLMLSALFLLTWTFLALYFRWNLWAEDLSAVYIAGWLWQHGQPELIYDAPAIFFGGVAESWGPAMEALGIADKISFAYVYPPLWVALTGPVTDWLGPQAFTNAVSLVQIPALAGCIVLAGRLLRPASMPRWVWTLAGIAILCFSIESILAIWHNQPSISVAFLILLAFERAGAGRPVIAGAALALAAAIKLTPAAYVLLFLLDRQMRATVSFIVFGAALGLLSIALAGWPAHADFLAALDKVSGVTLLASINISLKPALMAAASVFGLLPPLEKMDGAYIFTYTPAWLSPLLGLLCLAVIAAFAKVLAPLDGHLRRGIGLFALSIILAIFGPLGWLHYFIVPILLLPGLLGLMPRRQAMVLIGLTSLLSFMPFFSLITYLPFPVANFIWLCGGAWIAVLTSLFFAARRLSR